MPSLQKHPYKQIVTQHDCDQPSTLSRRAIVYLDRGETKGMKEGMAAALRAGREVERRTLGPSWHLWPRSPITPTIRFTSHPNLWDGY